MMQVVSFGNRLVALIAQLVFRKTAEFASDDYIEEKLGIEKLTYMDEIPDSLKSLDIAKPRTSDLDELLPVCSSKIKKRCFQERRNQRLPCYYI